MQQLQTNVSNFPRRALFEQRKHRVQEFLRMLPERHYGEAALTALGLKPVSLLHNYPPLKDALSASQSQMGALGLKLTSVELCPTIKSVDSFIRYLMPEKYPLLINKEALSEVSIPGLTSSVDEKLALKIIRDEKMRHKYGGALFGYPIEYFEPHTGNGFRIIAVNINCKAMAQYIGFRWALEHFKSPLENEYLRDLLDAAALVEKTRGSNNVLEFSVTGGSTLEHQQYFTTEYLDRLNMEKE